MPFTCFNLSRWTNRTAPGCKKERARLAKGEGRSLRARSVLHYRLFCSRSLAGPPNPLGMAHIGKGLLHIETLLSRRREFRLAAFPNLQFLAARFISCLIGVAIADQHDQVTFDT